MIFRSSAAAELDRPALAETALEQLRHPAIVTLSGNHRIPENTQATLAKTSICSHLASCIFAKNSGCSHYPRSTLTTYLPLA